MCYSPIYEGGIGIQRLFYFNKALLSRVAWKLSCSNGFVYWFLCKCFLRFNLPRVSFISSSIWPSLRDVFVDIQGSSQWLPGFGSQLNFWTSNFLGYSIADKIGIPLHYRSYLCASISDFFCDHTWYISDEFSNAFPQVVADMINVVFSSSDDHFV